MDGDDRIADLECALANARADASDCCDGYEGQIAMLQEVLKNTQSQLAATTEERDTWKDGAETLAMQVKDLQHEVEKAHMENGGANDALCAANVAYDALMSRFAMVEARAKEAERQLAEMRRALNRIARGADLQAHVMRDPLRTGGWSGSEKVADAFDDIVARARAAVQNPDAKSPPG